MAAITLCTSRILNTISGSVYAPTALPLNYLWGCPPGQLCHPPQVDCNFERNTPALSFICAPDQCVNLSDYPAPVFANYTDTREKGYPYLPENYPYFNLDPQPYGLSYDIYEFTPQPASYGEALATRAVDVRPAPPHPQVTERAVLPAGYDIRARQVGGIGPVPQPCFGALSSVNIVLMQDGLDLPVICAPGGSFSNGVTALEMCISSNPVNPTVSLEPAGTLLGLALSACSVFEATATTTTTTQSAPDMGGSTTTTTTTSATPSSIPTTTVASSTTTTTTTTAAPTTTTTAAPTTTTTAAPTTTTTTTPTLTTTTTTLGTPSSSTLSTTTTTTTTSSAVQPIGGSSTTTTTPASSSSAPITTTTTAVSGSTSVVGGTTTVVGGSTTVVGGSTTVVSGTTTVVGGSTSVVGGTTTVVGGTTVVSATITTVTGGTTSVVGGTTITSGGSTTVVGGSTTVIGGSTIVTGTAVTLGGSPTGPTSSGPIATPGHGAASSSFSAPSLLKQLIRAVFSLALIAVA